MREKILRNSQFTEREVKMDFGINLNYDIRRTTVKPHNTFKRSTIWTLWAGFSGRVYPEIGNSQPRSMDHQTFYPARYDSYGVLGGKIYPHKS